ncbi:MAG TPA: hypothetical protein GXX24_14500 [Paracoccus solventivorans]|uniref:Uncharacterized protein n=1 Tax=Paracoccus solventivorans TaxID=53463 RepID=A0A832PPT8_9RHOB|nr:hypothetical protein [Paracoccus solventivorans]HHW35329.1 hypothetical protein [Paracoccus solventivorans]
MRSLERGNGNRAAEQPAGEITEPAPGISLPLAGLKGAGPCIATPACPAAKQQEIRFRRPPAPLPACTAESLDQIIRAMLAEARPATQDAVAAERLVAAVLERAIRSCRRGELGAAALEQPGPWLFWLLAQEIRARRRYPG